MSVEYFFFLLKICISVRGLRLIQGRYTQTIGKRKKKMDNCNISGLSDKRKKTLPEKHEKLRLQIGFLNLRLTKHFFTHAH